VFVLSNEKFFYIDASCGFHRSACVHAAIATSRLYECTTSRLVLQCTLLIVCEKDCTLIAWLHVIFLVCCWGLATVVLDLQQLTIMSNAICLDSNFKLLTLIRLSRQLGVKCPSPLLPQYLQNCKRYGYALFRHCQGLYSPLSSVTSLPEMLTWWRGNRKYILGNHRKVVWPILNVPKSNIHFQWLLSCFMGTWPEYAVCMVSWCHSSPEVQYGWRINYENERKSMVWICASEMCDIHQEHVGFVIIYLLCSKL